MLKWNFRQIKLSAKKYKTKAEWRKSKNSSYWVANNRGLTNNKHIISHFSKPKKWTLQKIINDAKKYRSKKSWYETPKSSYDAAKSRGLLKDKKIIGHFLKNIYPSQWTLKKIITDAQKYNTRKEWRLGSEKNKSGNSYSAARERKLLRNKKIVGHFKVLDKSRKWTYTNIVNTAKKFDTIKDWADKYPYAYQRAYKTNVLKKVTSHMERIGHKYKRCLYSIEVKNEKKIYIGLTFNFKQRILQHLASKRFLEIKKKFGNKSLISKQISGYISVDRASNREIKLIEGYKKDGFEILNIKKGGELGSISSKWTKKKIIASAKKFKTQAEWRKKVSAAYSTARKHGYLKEVQKYLIVQRNKIRKNFR
jgi:predicted GIY-YIG superfamily endonuclease